MNVEALAGVGENADEIAQVRSLVTVKKVLLQVE